MQCNYCEHLIEDPNALYCAQCGQALCRARCCCFCGKPFQDNANYCDRCGMPVGATPPDPEHRLDHQEPPTSTEDETQRLINLATSAERFKAVVADQVRRSIAESQGSGSLPLETERLPVKSRFGIQESDWVTITGGHYLMGSPDQERDRFDNERRHEVEVASFEILKTPVTFAMFDIFCNDTKHSRPADEAWGRGNRPVINITYWSAMEYCFWLSEHTASNVRLATEAEWEYACRAGTETPFWTGQTITTDQANFDGNYTYGGSEKGVARGQTTPVDMFKPNPWGLHDMHGNIWEWCASIYDEAYTGLERGNAGYDQTDLRERVVRGGSWYNVPGGIRSASRNKLTPNFHYFKVGFRIVREAG